TKDPLVEWVVRAAGKTHTPSVESIRETLNQRLFHYPWAPCHEIIASQLVSPVIKARYTWYAHFLKRLGILGKPDLMRKRGEVDDFLHRLDGGPEATPRLASEREGYDKIEAAAFARKASNWIFRRLVYRMAGAYILLVLFAAAAFRMVASAWNETYHPWSGEPFSLVTGISAWPTEFMRLIAAALACCFLIDSY